MEGFCQAEIGGVFLLAEIMAGTQLRETDDLGTSMACLLDPFLTLGEIMFGRVIQVELNDSDLIGLHVLL